MAALESRNRFQRRAAIGARDFLESIPRRPSPTALTAAVGGRQPPSRIPRASIRHTFPSTSLPARQSGPQAGGEAVKELLSFRYPATKGSAGGKLPVGKGALRSPRSSLSDASRNAPTKAA